MIITGLRIVNFKNYSGFNKFDFKITPEKNVILIGGMNGAGKTSLSESIRLCLYGSKLNGVPLSDYKYFAYLEKMWSKDNKNQSMYIEMDVEIDDNDKTMNLTIKRSFYHTGENNKTITEKLILTRNGNEVELIDKNYWEYYIQRIIPAHISRYFFFDGEKTRDIISSNQSKEYLRTAIRDITEISKLDILSNDLDEVRKRLLHNDIKPSVRKKIISLESSISSIESDITSLTEEYNQLIEKKNKIDIKIEAQKQEYNRIIGIKKNERDAVTADIQKLTTELSTISDKVSDFSYNSLFKIILHNAIKETLNAARQEDIFSNQLMINELINDNLNSIRVKLKRISLSDNEIDKITNIIKSMFSPDAYSEHNVIIDLTPGQIKDIESQIEIGEERYAFPKLLIERENLMIQKSRLEKESSRYDDTGETFESTVQELIYEQQNVIESINQKIGAIQIKKEDVEKLRSDLDKLERSLTLSERDQQSVQNIDKLKELIKIKTDIASEKSIADFEKSLNEMYACLKNKNDMVKFIHIDKDYDLRLEGFDGIDVDVEWISEGEKGILMYSVMYALTNLSKSRLPLIIDSPLGRMDSIHVRNLISKLYPRIGSQVIILSHDREITKDTVPAIEPIISKIYLLTRNTPKVQEGYFK